MKITRKKNNNKKKRFNSHQFATQNIISVPNGGHGRHCTVYNDVNKISDVLEKTGCGIDVCRGDGDPWYDILQCVDRRLINDWTQIMNAQGLRSETYGGQATGPTCPIQLPGYATSRWLRTSRENYLGHNHAWTTYLTASSNIRFPSPLESEAEYVFSPTKRGMRHRVPLQFLFVLMSTNNPLSLLDAYLNTL